MTEGNGNKLANRAILSLTAISIIGILGGILVAYLGQPIGAVIAIVTGAVGGIVAIAVKFYQTGGSDG